MKRLLFFAFILLLSSCGDKKQQTLPSPLLTEQEMISILTDVQIIEADLTHRKTNQQDISGMPQQFYDQLFEHYGITDSIFSENLKYYSRQPATMERLMDSVTMRLTKEQSTFSAQ
jgi:hypothetical protein